MKIKILLLLLLVLSFTSCTDNDSKNIYSTDEKVQLIVEKTEEPDNVLPNQFVEFQFLDFILPNEQSNKIFQSIRFENITDETIKMRVWAFYNKELDDYIIARDGMITLFDVEHPLEVVEIEAKKGYVINNTLTLLYDFTNYSETEILLIENWASEMYIQMEINSQMYYFIMDLQNSEIIG